jgi:hypothetical protein
MSRVILANPITLPPSPITGSITTWVQNRVPSLRTRHPSASKRPSVSAVFKARAGIPMARSSSV